MDKLTIPKEVVDGNGTISTVVSVVIQNAMDGAVQVKRDAFLDTYEEYVDPKDVEIKRLLGIIQELEEAKIVKPTRRHLTKEERDEVKSLYEQGVTVQDIAREYAVSDSSIYKWAKDNHWEIKG